jgi:hypothetical protein
MEITADQLKEYTTKNATPKRWKCYDDSVKLYKALKTHADGEYPHRLIDKRRPSESEQIKEYRKEIYEPITEGTFSKVITSLAKIRKASDWSIKYNPMDVSAKIIDGEKPEDYFEENFPYFKSLTNWTFNVGLKNYLIDANAVIVVMPLEIVVAKTSYLRPFPFIYNSDQVYDFQEEQFCVLYSTDKSTYGTGTAKKFDGDIYYVITDQRIQRYDQINGNGDLELKVDYPHNLGYMPAFRMKGIFKKALDKTIMWKSRIASIVPGLNEAAREYSDLQAEVVQHIHSTMWMYATQDCVECRGIGQVQREGRAVTCEVCKGQGKYNASPYVHQVIRPPQVGETSIPNPPMGYVEKQTDIVKIQDERIDKHIYKALQSINMEFLAETPLNQSGVAKAVDQDELNVFVNSIASDIVAIMREIMRTSIDYRYRVVVSVASEREKLIPTFNVPEKFDLLSSNMLILEIKTAKEGSVDPAIINEMNVDYASKKFTGEPEVMELVKLTLQLDPFPGISDDDKMNRMQNSGISKLDYVVSCNIHQFVKRAIAEDEKFVTLDYDDQREKLEEYAQEIIDTNDAAAQLRMKQQQLALQQQSPDPGATTVNGDNEDQNTSNTDSGDGDTYTAPASDKADKPAAE